MITTHNVNYTYENTIEGAALTGVTTDIAEGQVVLLCGESGSGKTTYIKAINGLLSHYYEGKMDGEIMVSGKDISKVHLYELARDVGSVFQNPKSQFYTLMTDTEIVFGCENMGFKHDDILKRFDKVVKAFKIEDLLGKNLYNLSGGEKQKVACASVGALMPKIFVLDEPSSNLDIKSIHELRDIIEIWKKNGKTILIAEHRLNWLKDVADRVICFEDGKIKFDTTAKEFFDYPVEKMHEFGLRAPEKFEPKFSRVQDDAESISISRMKLTKNKETILDVDNLEIPKGSVVAIVGNCGAGKSTFARCLCGLEKKAEGMVIVSGRKITPKERIKKSYMVMQDVNHQLFTSSVEEEVMLGVTDLSEEEKEQKLSKILEEMDISKYKEAHPMSLSGGQKQRVAIAGALACNKDVIFYDEPTSGLDYRHMKEVSESIKKLNDMGKTQFIITHDPELVQECCNYFIYMVDGKIELSGSWNKENIRFVQSFFKLD